MKASNKVIFGMAIVFVGLAIFTFTLGQILPVEFADYKVQHKFYRIIIEGLPIAVLLTLFGTVKQENSKTKNWMFGILTVLASILCLVGQFFMILAFGFGVWTTDSILCKHKTYNREIKEQIYDLGAFGYGGHRTVEIQPFLTFWILPTKNDTATIDKKEWDFINKQGDK